MDAGQAPDPTRARDLPEFIDALGQLRMAAGDVSYRDLAKRVSKLLNPPQTVAHSTIAAIFGPRRRRLDIDLLMATVRALGLSAPDSARWREAYLRIQRDAASGGPTGVLRQLPADLATFTGREPALKQLIGAASATVGRGRPATVVISAIEGMAGVGKTQLAVHAAHELVRAGRFTEFQLYVNLRGFDPDHPPADPAAVLDAFLRQLGVAAPHVPDTLEERAAMFRDCLHGRHGLVVLDNAADTGQVHDLIPSSPSCLVLITSRRSLTDLDGAASLQLAVFSRAEAVELLGRIVGAERVDAEPEAAARIVQLCGHLPLAVSLAGARLRSRPAWRLDDLVKRLSEGGLDAAAVGSRTLRRIFDLSHQGLPPAVRQVFWQIALHPGSDFAEPAAAALTGLGIADSQAVLDLFLDEHMLMQEVPGRYLMHDLVRDYARDLAAAQSRELRAAAIERVTAWYAQTAWTAEKSLTPDTLRISLLSSPTPEMVYPPLEFTDYDHALAWFDSERSNLVAAVDHAAASGLNTLAARLTLSMSWFLRTRGHWAEWLRILHVAREAIGPGGDPVIGARVHGQLGAAHSLAGQFDEAVVHYRQALQLRRSTADRFGEAMVLVNLAGAYRALGRIQESIECRQAVQALSHHLDDEQHDALNLSHLAWAHQRQGSIDEAIDFGTKTLARFRAVGDTFGQAEALSELGSLHLEQGQYDQAAAFLRQALEMRREAGNRHDEAAVLIDLGEALSVQGQTAESIDALQTAHLILLELAHPRAARLEAILNQAKRSAHEPRL